MFCCSKMPRRRLVWPRYRPLDTNGTGNEEETTAAAATAAPPGSPGNGPYKCEVAQCAKEYPRWKDFKRHQRSHENDKPHRCDQCELSFNVEYNLVLHKATHSVDNLECPECRKKFSRVASLKSHIMLHEKEEVLICPECGDEFGLQRALDEHLMEHVVEATGPKEHPCKICTEKFSMHYMLKEHMRQKHKPKFRSAVMNTKFTRRNLDRSHFHHGCEYCGKSFPKPSQLERHVRIHTGEKPYKCNQCDKAFNQNGALQVHMTKHTGNKPYSCEFCSQKFAQRGNLRAHIVRVHEINSELEQRFECSQCCCHFRKMSSLNAHISRVHNNEEVMNPLLSLKAALSAVQEGADWLDGIRPEGETAEEQQTTLDAHTSAVSGVLQQLITLSEQTVSDGDTQEQLQQLASGNSINSDILQQALENSGLTNSPGEGQKEGAAPETSTSTSTNTTVQDTSQVFAAVAEILQRRLTLKRHVPSGSRVHTCTYCNKTFKKPSDLVRHVRIHTNEKPFSCLQCDKMFTVKSTLMSHMKTHAGIKDYKCNVCNKLFSTHGSLKIHLRLHTGAKPFECPHCDKKFRTSGQRKAHMLSHFKDSVPRRPRTATARPRKQSDIDLPDIPLQEPILITDTGLIQQPPRNSNMYSAYLSDGLQQSGTSHDRPYQCTFCSKCFKKSSHLKQHVRSHTGERPYQCLTCLRSFISSGVLKAHERTHVGIKSYKCLICDSLFTTNGSLKRHMSTHTDVRPFMCPYCQKTFKTSVNCKKHMKMHKRELAMQAKQQGGDQTTTDQHDIQSITDQTGNLADQLAIEQASNSILALAQGQLAVAQDINAQAALNETNLASQTLTHQNLAQSNLMSDGLSQDPLTQAALGQNFGHSFGQQPMETISSGQTNIAPEHQISLQTQQIQQQLEAITGQSSVLFSQPTNNAQNVQVDIAPVATNTQIQSNTGTVYTAAADSDKRTYACQFCDKTFKKSSHLKQHIRSHTGEKPHMCMQCGRSFVSAGVLKTHQRIHSGIKAFKCNLCDTAFTTNGSLVRHMNIHTDQRPHQCNQCGQGFRKPLDLKRHMKEHAESFDTDPNQDGKRPRNVVRFNDEEAQEIAKKPLARNASVSERILVQMVNEKNRVSEVLSKEEELKRRPQFPNKCTHCPKSFKKPCDLARHIRTHTGEKPYKCHECGRTFAVKSTLVCHLRTHKGAKQVTCHICKTTFATVGSLKVHMRLHTGAKPFKCPHCTERFRTSGSRKQHVENHFKPTTARRRKMAEKIVIEKENENANQVVVVETSHAEAVPQVSVVTEQPAIQTLIGQQQAMPITVTSQEASNNEVGASAVLHGLELQLTGANLGQNLQIQGLDSNNITVQIDPSLLQQLQQLQQQNPITLQTGEYNVGQTNLQLSQPDLAALINSQGEITMAPNIAQGSIDPQTGLLVQMDPTALQQVPQMIRIDTGGGTQPQTIQIQTPTTTNTNVNQTQVINMPNSGLQTILPTMQNQATLIPNTVGMTSGQTNAANARVVPFLHGSDMQIAIPDALNQTTSQGDSSLGGQMFTIQTADRSMSIVQAEPSTTQSDTSNLGQTFQLSLSADQLTLQPNIILQQTAVEGNATATPANSMTTSQQPEAITVSSLVGSSGQSGTVTVNVLDLANLSSHETEQVATSGPSLNVQTEEEEEESEEEEEEEEEEVTVTDTASEMVVQTAIPEKPAMSAEAAAAAIGSIYPCTEDGCDEVFTKMQQLSRHQQQKHKDLRPHSCNICGKSFKRPGHLKDHLVTHEGQAGGVGSKKAACTHVCATCGKAFAKPSQLERHNRTHTGEKPFSCPECGKSFSQKNSLQIHMNVHTKERPYRCDYCEFSFTQKGNLKTHMARAHSSIAVPPSETEIATSTAAAGHEELDIESLNAFMN